MKKIIKNSDNEKIELLVEGLVDGKPKPLAICMHGLSAHKDQVVVRIPAKAFLENGYTVITFDTRHATGESDGDLSKASLSESIKDLKTVISWASKQGLYNDKIALCGHSLGGATVLKYAEDNPNKVSKLVLLSALVSGDLYRKSQMENYREKFLSWEKNGFYYRERSGFPEKNGYVSFDFVRDLDRYDMVRDAEKLCCPVVLITGDNDKSSTVYDNELLYNKIKALKSFNILENCEHFYTGEQNKKDLFEVINSSLIRLNNLSKKSQSVEKALKDKGRC